MFNIQITYYIKKNYRNCIRCKEVITLVVWSGVIDDRTNAVDYKFHHSYFKIWERELEVR